MEYPDNPKSFEEISIPDHQSITIKSHENTEFGGFLFVTPESGYKSHMFRHIEGSFSRSIIVDTTENRKVLSDLLFAHGFKSIKFIEQD